MDVQHPRFEPAHAQRQLREDEAGDGKGHPRPLAGKGSVFEVVVARCNLADPVRQQARVGEQVPHSGHDDDRREADVGHHEDGRQPDHLAIPLEEHAPEQHEQEHGHGHLTLHPFGRVACVERIRDQVGGGVGGGEGLRDHEVGRREADEDEHRDFRGPPAEHPLDHAHGADAVRGFARHVAVDGQRPEQRHQHEDQRGDRRQRAGALERDRRLVAERAEVIHAAEAHDEPPGVVMMIMGRTSMLLSRHSETPWLGPQGRATARLSARWPKEGESCARPNRPTAAGR